MKLAQGYWIAATVLTAAGVSLLGGGVIGGAIIGVASYGAMYVLQKLLRPDIGHEEKGGTGALREQSVVEGITNPVGRVERECPYCAELILAKARVCKHCGRDVIPIPEVGPHVGETDGLGRRLAAPSSIPLDAEPQPDAVLMAHHGITFDGKHYCYGGFRYDKYSDALAYAQLQEQ